MDQTIPPTLEKKKFTGVAARIMTLIVGGCTETQAAAAIGISKSFVSQLMQDPEFQQQVTENVRAEFEKAQKIDSTYLEVERQLSERLLMMSQMIQTPDGILKALRVVNGMQSRTHRPYTGDGNPNSPANPQERGATRLQLPNVVIQNFVVSPQGEVLQVEGRNLTTLNSASLSAMVAAKNAAPKPAISGESVRIKEIENEPRSTKVPIKDKWGDL